MKTEIKRLKQFEELVNSWAKDKDLIKIENARKQADKTQEELDELKFNLTMQELGCTAYHDKKGIFVKVQDQIKDDIGDLLVTLQIQCEIQGISLLECMEIAWNEIKDRKGKTVGGTFIKN